MRFFELLGHPFPELRVGGALEHLGEAVHKVVDDRHGPVAECVDARLHGLGHLLTGEPHQFLAGLALDVEHAPTGLAHGRPEHPGPEVLVAPSARRVPRLRRPARWTDHGGGRE
ncbi:hypothetical protein [Streptomyces sp. I8-5]|uniref:hypothetical protein n=1 Tax=Streptomyces sp. I8-5 TaxID=3104277 RepID=UPI00386D593D